LPSIASPGVYQRRRGGADLARTVGRVDRRQSGRRPARREGRGDLLGETEIPAAGLSPRDEGPQRSLAEMA
jgi:hypothetical protein